MAVAIVQAMTSPSTAPIRAAIKGAVHGTQTRIDRFQCVYGSISRAHAPLNSSADPKQAVCVTRILDYPLAVFVLALVTQWVAAYVGDFFRTRQRIEDAENPLDLTTVLTAALTLLALIIGFSFSMAVSRYEQRKNYEEAEANAIGTEYVRADLLPAATAATVRDLLRKYIEQRVLFYEVSDQRRLLQIDAETAKLQGELWSAVVPLAEMQPTPVVALIVSGMNDVLNSQGYTQAAWWNRIPAAAWELLCLVAIFCNLLLGYSERRTSNLLLIVMPVIVSVSFVLIADIDSPRRGHIRVLPQNLIALSQSIRGP
jgi:hypothetical protein